MAFDQSTLLQLLKTAVNHSVSDIHLRGGMPPAFRVSGGLSPVKMAALTETDMQQIAAFLIKTPEKIQKLGQLKDFDGSYLIKGLARFRYNIFRHGGSLGIVLRVIPEKIPTIEELGLPEVLKKLAMEERGLILVTGATGSGKSSTLAAMIDHINRNKACHILTAEDPIEFYHPQMKARVTQREVGTDTGNFADALKYALRQDPDVILVGEMRDIETIDIALKAAETGHVVFSTVHTTDAIKTIGRLVSMFPAEEQKMVRLRLADNLKGTISQRLLKRQDGKGRVVTQEIMVSNRAIQECIEDPKKTGEMNEFIEKGHDLLGSQTFEQHLTVLYQKGLISLKTAKEGATNPGDFERNLMFGSESTKTNVDNSDGPTQAPEMNLNSLDLDFGTDDSDGEESTDAIDKDEIA